MVRKQVGLENNASLAVSQQQPKQQQEEQKDNKQQQQKHLEQDQPIDTDLSQRSSPNYAKQAQAIYAPLHPSLASLSTGYDHGSSRVFSLQHMHIGTMPYNLHAVSPQNMVANSGQAILPSEIPVEDEERLERIFKQLDRDGDGRIDIHDLSAALHEFGLSSVYAEVSRGRGAGGRIA